MEVSYKKLWKLLIDKDMKKRIYMLCRVGYQLGFSYETVQGRHSEHGSPNENL